MAVKLLHLKVMDKQRVIFDGKVESVSSSNLSGDFDVLEMHANFITLIQGALTWRVQNEEPRQMQLSNGIMKVNQDEVVVFIGSQEEIVKRYAQESGREEDGGGVASAKGKKSETEYADEGRGS